ncbi:ATP-binding cassette domain-containing protein [Bacillus sp. S3]|uniref:ABC transporter ATP-binding protein n=1 Tax=Bacillus sp. S3 TaxID=486398 RepID=UPI00118CDBE2|nr:energy-coupling factor transporter ATPase [Bacillus sp. S3]QCJ44723.1 ATP-binding cassette domain-containing protein [Bacillus sp. S3]
MPIVELQNISWKYNSNDPQVLSDISLDVNQKEFIGIMGPTGAGKSTLSLVIRGLIPDFFEDGILTGKAVVSGVEVSASSPNLIVNYVGSVFQDASSQILGTTVFDDIAFGPCNLGLPKEEVISRVNTYIDRLNLKKKLNRKPDSLSGGETQRLVSAGVLCMEPLVLVMDEPAAELDPKGRNELCEILDDLRQGKDITVVLIEQDPELIAQYSSKVALMSEGKIVSYGPSREVFNDVTMCEKIGVAPPEMVRLANELKRISGITFSELPLTPSEMYSSLLGKMGITVEIESKSNYEEKLYHYLPFKKNEKPLYQFDHVIHTFETPGGPFNALDGVSLNIYKGDYITFIGTNGAGKSTLTKHINNILSPTSGRVLLKGEDIQGRDTSDFLSEVGYCFQNPDHQIFSNTVKEEVAYGLVNLGLEQEVIDRRVDEILDLLDLSEIKDENPFNLGKGERQKIAIASTVVMEPEFLVIDEPTTGLDWFESKKILELIERLHKRGMTILAVTHDMRIVREYSSRVVAMHQGNIVYDGDVTGLLDYKELFETANISLPPILELYHKLKQRLPMIAGENVRTINDMADLIVKLMDNHKKILKGDHL